VFGVWCSARISPPSRGHHSTRCAELRPLKKGAQLFR
jgi:hypothetical protein